MNEKEIGELRRRFSLDKSNITHVRGCYVNEHREILSQFDQTLAVLSQEESEKILAILKRTLTGALGKNLNDITFATAQVAHGEAHKRLMTLRASSLGDDEAVQEFFQQTIAALSLETGYLILLAHEAYDVPFRSRDGDIQEDASSEVFSYIVCSICPVKMTKSSLGYYIHENQFHNSKQDWLVSPPEVGFLFPAFDQRSTNLYNALYYTRDAKENHAPFAQAIFQSDVPPPAAVQKETFEDLLEETLEEACSLDVVQSVHEQLCGMIAEHKEQKETEPLRLSKAQLRHVFATSGASGEQLETFETQFDQDFGAEADLTPRNLVNAKQLEVRMPDVTIHISADKRDLLETRVINGAKYVLIRAEEGVEVNGVAIHIS